MARKKVNNIENLEMRAVETLDDAELVELCRRGNQDAFGRLVEKYQNSAMALALSYVRDFHDAQEVVQEAFLQAYCKLVQLNDPKRFKSWFHTIVANRCRSWLRKRSNAFSPLDASIQTDLVRLSIRRERQAELRTSVWDTVDTLPEKYRTVVLLYYMNDYSYSEIAGFLNLSVSTVKGRLQQARLKLKREFEPEEINYQRGLFTSFSSLLHKPPNRRLFRRIVMLWLIIRREFVSNILTFRFMVGFILCLLLFVSSAYVLTKDYEQRLANYSDLVTKHRDELAKVKVYAKQKGFFVTFILHMVAGTRASYC